MRSATSPQRLAVFSSGRYAKPVPPSDAGLPYAAVPGPIPIRCRSLWTGDVLAENTSGAPGFHLQGGCFQHQDPIAVSGAVIPRGRELMGPTVDEWGA